MSLIPTGTDVTVCIDGQTRTAVVLRAYDSGSAVSYDVRTLDLQHHYGLSADSVVRGTPERVCIRCGIDLSDVMGVYVFVLGHRKPGLLCVPHGSNGANSMSLSEYLRLVTADV